MHYVGLLLATFFPPVIVALLNRGVFGESTKAFSPKTVFAGVGIGMGGWKPYKYTEYGPGGATQKTADASFYHAFDLLIVIKISLAIIFIYSVQYTLNRGGASEFQSSGTITITVGGDNFTDLESPGNVQINISSGSIKKYDKGELQEIKGTTEPLPKGTKLVIEATGRISGISGSEVTIKGTVNVSSNVALGNKLALGPDLDNDPSSTGLSGSITPQGDNSKAVTISSPGGSITLDGNALNVLKSLTKNTVTLSGTGAFRSNAAIIITRGEGSDVNFKTLTVGVGQNLQISISQGTIKNSDGTELQTETPLNPNTVLKLDAIGTITQPSEAKSPTVNIVGTIVVTSTGKAIGSSGLTFAGGPNRAGVTGTLNLDNDESSAPKHIKINGSSTITIESDAYTAIKSASDTICSSFTIGAADPRNPTEATGGAETLGLNTEECFTKYWHVLPSDMYDKKDSPDWTSIFPALMVLLVATIFPPMIVVILQIVDKNSDFTATKHSPKFWQGWGAHNLRYWHWVDVCSVINRAGYDFLIVFIDILVAIIISLVAAIVWTWAYGFCTDSGAFDGTITYTTTKDITSIIITDIPTKSTEAPPETIDIHKGKVTITTGTLAGTCTWTTQPFTTTAPPKTIGNATKAKIAPDEDGKATLEIDIAITEPAADAKDAVDALADLAIPVKGCTVNVKDENTLTIKITYAKNDAYAPGKCTDIEITDITDLAKLGLQNTVTGTVKVDPAPNHLTIKYETATGNEKKISGPAAKPKGPKGNSITEVTKKIAQEIKNTFNPPNTATGAKNYYTVTDHKTEIRYYFKLTGDATQLTAGKPTPATIIVDYEYGHILAEGFGGWKQYISTHVNTQDQGPGQPEDPSCKTGEGGENPDVHAWIWHFFDTLIVLKILLTAILYIHFTTTILWTLAYGYYTNTQKTVITYPNTITGNVTIKECSDETTTELTATKATITTPDETKGPTLTITTIHLIPTTIYYP